jgi:hypothetical protein
VDNRDNLADSVAFIFHAVSSKRDSVFDFFHKAPNSLTAASSILIDLIVNFGNGASPDLFHRYAPHRRVCKQR